MKKTYIIPELDVVEMNISRNMLIGMSDTTAGGNDTLAPELPGFSDDELFQFIMIHQ